MNRMSTSSVTPHRAYGSIPQPNLLWPRVLPFYSSVSGPWEHGGAKTKEVARLTAILGSQIPRRRRDSIVSKTKESDSYSEWRVLPGYREYYSAFHSFPSQRQLLSTENLPCCHELESAFIHLLCHFNVSFDFKMQLRLRV